MNIIKILKQEHREVGALFKKLSKTSEHSPKIRSELLSRLELKLGAHAATEETVLYTALKMHKKTRPDTFEAFEEHGVAKRFLAELLTLSPADERWTGKMTVLNEMIDHHVKEEEEDLFKKAAAVFSTLELEKMGLRYCVLRDHWLLTHKKSLQPRLVKKTKAPAHAAKKPDNGMRLNAVNTAS